MKGIHSVYSFVAIVLVTGLLGFSSSALSADSSIPVDSQKAQKPAHAQSAAVVSAVNINKADLQTLAQLNGVGEKKAQAIIAYRESSGGFKTVDDLLNVKGIGEKILSKNRALLSVN